MVATLPIRAAGMMLAEPDLWKATISQQAHGTSGLARAADRFWPTAINALLSL